jgi:transcription elongation factor Elf1
MKRNTILKSMLALSLMGALILVGGCKSMDGKDDAVNCPKCGKKTVTITPKTGRTYHKVACPSCHKVTTVDPDSGVTTTTHACTTCDTLVAPCPKCKGM